jgi:ABC-type glycerol-3-phosphate transport system substrate-binding protein
MRKLVVALCLSAAAAGTAACGGDSSSSSAASAGTAPAAGTALREAGETAAALQTALASYEAGDRAKAEEQVSEAYVSHFEEVEHALEEKDAELKEKLEEAIRTDLRKLVRSDDGAAVRRAFAAVLADLAKAEALLR